MEKPFLYENIVFFQGSEADEVLAIYDEHGPKKAADYMAEREDHVDGGEICEGSPWGTSDSVHHVGRRYYVTANTGIGYVGYCRKLTRAEQKEHEENMESLKAMARSKS